MYTFGCSFLTSPYSSRPKIVLRVLLWQLLPSNRKSYYDQELFAKRGWSLHYKWTSEIQCSCCSRPIKWGLKLGLSHSSLIIREKYKAETTKKLNLVFSQRKKYWLTNRDTDYAYHYIHFHIPHVIFKQEVLTGNHSAPHNCHFNPLWAATVICWSDLVT